MATEAVKLKRQKQVDRANAIFKGAQEPIVTKEKYSIDFLHALNYYNMNGDSKVMRKWFMTYIKKNQPSVASIVDKAADHEIYHAAIVVRLLDREQYVDEKELSHIDKTIKELSAKYAVVAPTKVQKKLVTNIISIDDRITESARKHAAEFDYEIDKFVEQKSSEFSPKTYLLKNSISGAVSKKLGEFYKSLQRELTEAIGGKCEQLNEGYSHLTKPQLKKFLAFVDQIILDCQQQVVDSKVRKPRTVKAKPAGVLVAKMKYQIKNDEYGLKSCNPADIIGSTEMWVFNTKTRKLTVYRANKGEVLSVRGTTITNFDLSSSETKTLRKPVEFFRDCGVTKRPLTAAFNAIKTKGVTPNGRVNEETILLKAF